MTSVMKRVTAKGDMGHGGLVFKRLAKVASLVAHKRPFSRLLEVALDGGFEAGHSIWIDRVQGLADPIVNRCTLRLSTPSQKAGLEARERYAHRENIEYVVNDDSLGLGKDNGVETFDLVILKVSHGEEVLKSVLQRVQNLLTKNGYLVILVQNNVLVDDICPQGLEPVPEVTTITKTDAFEIAYLGTLKPSESSEEASPSSDNSKVQLVHFGSTDSRIAAARDLLESRGWEVVGSSHLCSEKLLDKSTVLVLDEMFSPLISNLNDSQFVALRALLDKECRVLWVTMG